MGRVGNYKKAMKGLKQCLKKKLMKTPAARPLGCKVEALAAPRVDAPATPRGYIRLTLRLYRMLPGEFMHELGLPICYTTEHLTQLLERSVWLQEVCIEGKWGDAHLGSYQLYWNDVELKEGRCLQNYVEDHGMPVDTPVDIKVYMREAVFEY